MTRPFSLVLGWRMSCSGGPNVNNSTLHGYKTTLSFKVTDPWVVALNTCDWILKPARFNSVLLCAIFGPHPAGLGVNKVIEVICGRTVPRLLSFSLDIVQQIAREPFVRTSSIFISDIRMSKSSDNRFVLVPASLVKRRHPVTVAPGNVHTMFIGLNAPTPIDKITVNGRIQNE
ncbi:hypothetical protein AB1N83_000659 [Pleurotus pulmonarius]